MSKFKYVCLLIGLWVIAYLVTFDPAGNEYLKKGIKVEATISKKNLKIRHGYDYNCYYTNDKGERVTAYLILNQDDGEIGQVIEGYYLPEEPKTVWCKPDKGFMLVFTLIVDLVAIGMTLLPVIIFITNKKDDNEIPDYAMEFNENYVSRDVEAVKTNPWNNSQTSTWDQRNNTEEDNHDDGEEWSSSTTIENKESSTGLKLKL